MLFDVAKHCSEPVSVGDFKAKCLSVIGQNNIQRLKRDRTLEEISDSLETDPDTARELIEICDPSNLKCPLEAKINIESCDVAKLPKEIPLNTVRILKNPIKGVKTVNYAYHLKRDEQDEETNEPDLEDGTVLLSVVLFHPKKRKKEQGYLVVASQYLTELRDQIMCITDRILLGDRSLNPDLSDALKSKEGNKSGFFFIDDVFYNDTRDPYNRDYSKIIIDWAKENSSASGLGSFKSKKMEDTKFDELRIRLGYPYYYCHQGNCEHIMIFNDMRLLHNDDPPKLSAYPYKIFKSKPNRTKCSVCDLYTAKWVTFDDVFAFEDPSFFCTQCFDLLHYDEKKRKIHNFKAYHFDGSYNCQDISK